MGSRGSKVPPSDPRQRPLKHIFLLGNCEYQHMEHVALAIKDVEAVYEELCKHGPVHGERLYNATMSKFEELLLQPPRAEEVLFFFAGHMTWSDGDPLLLAVDAPPDGTTGLSLSRLLHWLTPKHGRKRHADLVLAGCLIQVNTSNPPQVQYPKRGEYTILFPTAFGRPAIEPVGGRLSYFVQGLLPYLSGDLLDNSTDIARAVSKLSFARQIPWVYSNKRSPPPAVADALKLHEELRRHRACDGKDSLRVHVDVLAKLLDTRWPLRLRKRLAGIIVAGIVFVVLPKVALALTRAVPVDVQPPVLEVEGFIKDAMPPSIKMERITDPKAGARPRIDKITGAEVARPSLIVISHTAGLNVRDAFVQFNDTGILQHFVIKREGGLVQCVNVSERAWHAGVSFWGPLGAAGKIGHHVGVHDVNSHSIGISLEGDGSEQEFTTAQYETLRLLLRVLCARFDISGRSILGFAEVAHPPGRHLAPGPKFNWSELAPVSKSLATPARILTGKMHEEDLAWDLPFFNATLMSLGYSTYSQGEGDIAEVRQIELRRRIQIVMDRYVGMNAWRMTEHPRDLRKAADVLRRLKAFEQAN